MSEKEKSAVSPGKVTVFIRHLTRSPLTRTNRAARSGHRRQGFLLADGVRIRQRRGRLTPVGLDVAARSAEKLIDGAANSVIEVLDHNQNKVCLKDLNLLLEFSFAKFEAEIESLRKDIESLEQTAGHHKRVLSRYKARFGAKADKKLLAGFEDAATSSEETLKGALSLLAKSAKSLESHKSQAIDDWMAACALRTPLIPNPALPEPPVDDLIEDEGELTLEPPKEEPKKDAPKKKSGGKKFGKKGGK